MAFITYPLNNIDYTAEDAELFHCTRTSGIWAEDSFSISVTGADNNVTVGTGIAWINNEEFSGKVTALKSAEVLDLGIADSTYPRIDVIAIQYSANNNATDVVIKKGTPATNPVRPTIVRSGAVYELYLASVYRPAGATAITASNITDLRMDETVCGLMADSVTKVDMTTIEAQIREFINSLQSEIDGIKDLSGLMFETEWTEDGVIPIPKGGTGKKTALEALLALGGIQVKKLWENASPTSAFATQTIFVDLRGYDRVEILFSTIISSSDTRYTGFSSAKIGDYGIFENFVNVDSSNTYKYLAQRWFKVNEDGILFNHAKTNQIGTQTSVDINTYCIPIAIYGIKGVL